MVKIIEAIIAINPKAEVSVTNEDYETIQWHNGTTPIAKAKIEAKMVELQDDYDSKQYQRNREKEYPSIADQLDKIYHSGLNEWKKVIKLTKDKYPK